MKGGGQNPDAQRLWGRRKITHVNLRKFLSEEKIEKFSHLDKYSQIPRCTDIMI